MSDGRTYLSISFNDIPNSKAMEFIGWAADQGFDFGTHISKAIPSEEPLEIELGHTEETLPKVFKSLIKAGLTSEEATECINDMQNQGLFFREIVEE